MASKQDNLSSASGTGNAILASNIIKRIDFDRDFVISDNGSKITVSLSSALSNKQDALATAAFREGHFRRAAPARSSVGPFIRPSVRTIRLRRTAGVFGEPLGLLKGGTRIYGASKGLD